MSAKNDLVITSPKILGGTPVIAGTRIPVSLVTSLVEKGYPDKLITTEYPSLSIQKVEAFRRLLKSSNNVSQTS